MEKKSCERCQTPFDCGAKEGSCWCQGATVSPAVLDDLKSRFGDCLCPKCLQELATGNASKSAWKARFH